MDHRSLLRQEQDAYEAVLAQEGLAPIEESAGAELEQGARGRTRPRQDEDAQAVEAFKAWAAEVLVSCAFHERGPGLPSTLTRRQVWRLYAQGRSMNQIAVAVGISRQKVVVAVQVTKRESGIPCPVSNPWLRRRYDKEEPMQRLGKVDYEMVLLRGDIKIPGHTAMKDRLVPMKGHDGSIHPLQGTPHSGGIDFELPTQHAGRKTTQTITVPWHKIEVAHQAAEDWIP